MYLLLNIFVLISVLTFNSYSAQDSAKDENDPGQDKKKIIYVKKINSSIKIDGLLDEPEWNQSVSSEGFIQQEPLDNSPATERTVVRIIRDDENIYFGIWCYDSEPDIYRADTKQLRNSANRLFVHRCAAAHCVCRIGVWGRGG